MSIQLNQTLGISIESPQVNLRYVSFKVEGSVEGHYGAEYETDLVDFSTGSEFTVSQRETSYETSANIGMELCTMWNNSVKIAFEEKLGELFDYLSGGEDDKTLEQVLAEMQTIDITWRGASGGRFENGEVTVSIAPFSAFVARATFLTVNVQKRVSAADWQLWQNVRVSIEAYFVASVEISVTPRGAVRIMSLFYNAAVRAARTTATIGSWISRTFSAAGLTGDAIVVGGTVIGGAIIGSAAATSFAMWLIDRSHRAGVARGLTNQMASGFVRYLYDRDNIYANLTERTGSRFFARVSGGNMAHRDVLASSALIIKETYKLLLFPEQTRGVTDQYVRSNMGVAIDRMTLILEESGLGYSADEILG